MLQILLKFTRNFAEERDMGWSLIDARTGEDVDFQYLSTGVGGKPIVRVGGSEYPIAEFVGMLVSYLRSGFAKSDFTYKWLKNLHRAEFRLRDNFGWTIDFTEVHRHIEADVIPFESGAKSSKPRRVQFFKIDRWQFNGSELCRAIEYLTTKSSLEGPCDQRLAIFDSVLTCWNSAEKMYEAENRTKDGPGKISFRKIFNF